MKNINISKVNFSNEDLRNCIDSKTKPLGALGILEKIGYQIGCIQKTVLPNVDKPRCFIFAGDHGAAVEGISAYPKEVTPQMVLNFLQGGAAINVFSRQNSIDLRIVDCGVNWDFENDNTDTFISCKIRKSTSNYFKEDAMTTEELDISLKNGVDLANQAKEDGVNLILVGEMGIGNTSSASLIYSKLENQPIRSCVGAGTGMFDELLEKKRQLLQKAFDKHIQTSNDVMSVMKAFGGFEITTMVGTILGAAHNRIPIVIDGFITTAAALCACKIDQNVKDYLIFAHQSAEFAHKSMLNSMNAEPILDMGLRLGEGTGAALVYPIIVSATKFIQEMASFQSASVDESCV